MNRFKLKKVLMVIVIAAAAITVFGFIVMSLWNAILPAVLGVKAITFVQALGILVLSKILFGGFGRGGGPFGRRKQEFREQMKAKWGAMTPEEREKFKAEWKNRCGGMRWGRQEPWQQKDRAAE